MPNVPNVPPVLRPRYTPAQVIAAIKANRGLISGAATALGCEPITVRRYADRHPTVAAALYEAREAMLDVAEASLFKQIGAGEGWAVKYYLSTQGKSRGYVERQEVTGKDGAPIAHTHTVDLAHLTPDELDALQSLLTKAGDST